MAYIGEIVLKASETVERDRRITDLQELKGYSFPARE